MAHAVKTTKHSEPFITISNGFYDFLKAFVMIIAPSAIAIYLGCAALFDFPREVEFEIALLACTIVLGFLVYFSSRRYLKSDLRCDGEIYVSLGETGEMLYSLELNDDPDVLRFKSHILFRVIDKVDDPDYEDVVS